ncbi:LOW QUALITY PROTEIN: hypothetical protein HID58_090494, partial [Brassica napus]
DLSKFHLKKELTEKKASRVIHDLGTSSSWRSPLTSSRSIARCAETVSHKANSAHKVPTRLSQNCVWVLTEAGIVALVKNRTFDMTIAIGDGNETSANDVSMIQMVDVAGSAAKKQKKHEIRRTQKIRRNKELANLLMYLSHNLNLTPTDTLTDTRLPYLNPPTA